MRVLCSGFSDRLMQSLFAMFTVGLHTAYVSPYSFNANDEGFLQAFASFKNWSVN